MISAWVDTSDGTEQAQPGTPGTGTVTVTAKIFQPGTGTVFFFSSAVDKSKSVKSRRSLDPGKPAKTS